jgi:hypothetical protein
MADEITSPLKAIRAKCLDCSNGSWKEVELCPCKTCDLWAFRFGKNPYRKKREMTEEQRAAACARLARARKSRGD